MPSLIPLAGAAIGAIGSAMSSGKGSGGTTTVDNTPWAPQATAMTGLYDTAKGVYDARAAAGPFTDATYSGINGIQANTANTAANWSAGQGAALANGTGATAGTLQSAADPYVHNADTMATNGTGAPNAANMGVLSGYANGTTTLGTGVHPDLSSALNTAATSGANSLNSFNSGLTSVAQKASQDPTAATINDGGLYANSGYARQLMDATNADITNTLGEHVAGLNREASAGGALNSSRAGVAEAMANRDAARQIALSDASIGNNAFNTGVSTAAGQNTAGLQIGTQANTAGLSANNTIAQGTANLQQTGSQFDTTSKLGAANSALTQDLGAANLDANTKLQANGQLGSAATSGVSAANAAQSLESGNATLGDAAGATYQNNQNAILADNYAQWQRQNGYGQSVLTPYAQIIQQGYNGAGSSNTSNTQPSNMMGNVVGGALAASGLYKNYTAGSVPNTTAPATMSGFSF